MHLARDLVNEPPNVLHPVAFAERSPQMTYERQAELADLLEPVTRARGSGSFMRSQIPLTPEIGYR